MQIVNDDGGVDVVVYVESFKHKLYSMYYDAKILASELADSEIQPEDDLFFRTIDDVIVALKNVKSRYSGA